jgi:Ni/Co efflux regulator RcnB
MRTLSLSILATSILALPAIAGPPPGATWQGHMGGQMGGPGGHVMIMRQGGPGPQMQMHQMPMHGGMQMHGGMNFPHHMRRGFIIPPVFFGPQFYVDNWQAYGFASPGPDQRWIRYYDDAYLVDGDGRVVDGREDMDWDRYGGDWDMEDGMPAHHRGPHGDRDGDGRGYAYGGGYGGPMPGGGYAYGGGYGYGFYAYPIVIETVTTTGGGYREEVTEEVVRVRAHHRRARCSCRPAPRPAPPRRPPPGERG